MDTLLLRSFSISQRGKTRDEPKTASEKIKASDERYLEKIGSECKGNADAEQNTRFFCCCCISLSLFFFFNDRPNGPSPQWPPVRNEPKTVVTKKTQFDRIEAGLGIRQKR